MQAHISTAKARSSAVTDRYTGPASRLPLHRDLRNAFLINNRGDESESFAAPGPECVVEDIDYLEDYGGVDLPPPKVAVSLAVT